MIPLVPDGSSRAAAGTLAALLVLTPGCAGLRRMVGLAPAPRHFAYTVEPAEGWAFAEREEEMDFLIPAFDPLHGAGPSDQIEARFRGNDRRTAKTRITDASVEDFETIPDLIDSLPSDDDMLDHDPPISRARTSDRVDEEERNVHVEAWIYAIKYEADQDWHVIAGTDPDETPRIFFNCEVSGLPRSDAAAFDDLLAVRQSLDEILDHDLPGPGSYRRYDEPIPVTLEGSLFYDIDHPAGVVGPTGLRPETAWEIHPITLLELR